MSDLSRATIFKVGPMEAAEAVSEIIELRGVIKPNEVVIPAAKLAFSALGGIFAGAEYIELLESGSKSLCTLLQFPHHLLKKLTPHTRAAMFAELFGAKFSDEHCFVQLRCAGETERKLRAILSTKQVVFNDRDVFANVIHATEGFTVDCYWADDYVSAIRFRAIEPLLKWQELPIYVGFDVVNSEVRDRSLEIRGVLWIGDFAIIPPKLIYWSFKGKNNHIGDLRGLTTCAKSLSAKLLGEDFKTPTLNALNRLRNETLSVGWELKNFFKRDIFTELDILKFLEGAYQPFSGVSYNNPRWSGKDAYALCDMEKNTRMPAIDFICMVSNFAKGFDTYAKRSSLEFGLNLLF